MNRPVLNTDSFEVSIRDLLKHVNDSLNLLYRNPDGTPNYGIYFGDHETGGVMFIIPKDNIHTTNVHGMEAAWTLTWKRPLPVPGIWYTAGVLTSIAPRQ